MENGRGGERIGMKVKGDGEIIINNNEVVWKEGTGCAQDFQISADVEEPRHLQTSEWKASWKIV